MSAVFNPNQTEDNNNIKGETTPMGLDMYLSVATYLHDFKDTPPNERAAYARVLSEAGVAQFTPLHGLPYVTVKLPVSMWKNAYQVHHWLVAHMPDGEDIRDAAREIARSGLEELLALCKQLLEKQNREQANNLLPWPGGVEIRDDWDFYWWNLRVTIRQLEPVLKDPQFVDWDFFYEAS